MRKTIALLAMTACILVAGSTASAQTLPFQGYAVDKFPACLTSVANDGALDYGLGCGGANYLWYRDTSTGWHPYDFTTFKQVSVSGEGHPWAVKTDGSIWRFSFIVGWEKTGQPGACAKEVAAGASDNDVWVVGCGNGADSSLWRYNGSVFVEPQPGAAAAHIAIGSNSRFPWALHSSGAVFKWNGSNFGSSLPGCATAIGGNGWIVGCGSRQSVWKYNDGNQPTLRAWTPTALKAISSNGTLALDDAGNVYTQSKITSFNATGYQTPVFTLKVTGTGFAASKNFSIYYLHPTTGAWKLVGSPFATTKADGTIDYKQSSVSASDCQHLQMRRNAAVFRNMSLRIDFADGNSTYLTSSTIYDACQPFLPL